ncbi:unnamed protein product, partial [Vitis vinifera]
MKVNIYIFFKPGTHFPNPTQPLSLSTPSSSLLLVSISPIYIRLSPQLGIIFWFDFVSRDRPNLTNQEG